MQTKTCSRCRLDKPLSDFANGLQYRCRACHKVQWDDYYSRNQKDLIIKRQVFRRKTGECRRLLYGLTPQMVLDMRTAQKDCCACCGDKFTKEPHVDHNHTTGKVRGLLCPGCNHALGFLKDSSFRCFLAASYLQKFGS